MRKKRDWGRCYRKAGFAPCGQSRGGLITLRLAPEVMPEPEPPLPRFGSHPLLFPDLAFLTSET